MCIMDISVIIPSYKPQDYLFECLNSLFRQTIPHNIFEVIIILNGCKDPYYSLIKERISLFKEFNVSILQTDISGVSNARNIGIDYANGKYITFIDDDDLVSPTYLEDLLVVSSPTCVGCANSYAFVDDITEKRDNFMSRAFERCKNKPYSIYSYRQFLSPPVIKLIHRDIIGKTRFPITLKKSEDSVFCLQLAPKIKKMALAANSAIYYQRIREGSAMRTKNSIMNEFLQLVKLELEYIKVYIRNPFSYNVLFFLSRMFAGCRNFLTYIK